MTVDQRIEEEKSRILSSVQVPKPTNPFYQLKFPITRDSLQAALETYRSVVIASAGDPIILDRPLIFSSDMHLRVPKDQVFEQGRGSKLCLVRNLHMQNGAEHDTDHTCRDENISISGGIWLMKNNVRAKQADTEPFLGALGAILFAGVNVISLSDMVIHDALDEEKRRGAAYNYGIQLSDCSHFTVKNIDFVDNHKDGLHVNGPAEYGYIRHLRGERLDDDLLALNAWDWYTSAVTYGTISDIVVEDIVSNNNELRLLPGRKLYPDGSYVDCDIHNIVLENISGIYTFKLYAQPNIANACNPDIHDVSGTVGNIYNIYFRDISFAEVTPSGLNGLPVKSLFEICADCHDLFWEDITVANRIADCAALDLHLVNVGPLSAVWKNGSDDPEKWGEVFDPDMICHVEGLYFRNIRFAGEEILSCASLLHEVRLHVNPDYPRTTPRGGTGYGTIGHAEITE